MLNFLFCYDLVKGNFIDFLWEFDYIKCSTWLKSETWEYLRVDRWSGQRLKTLLDHCSGGNLQLSWTSWRQSRGKGGGSVAVTLRSRGNHCNEKKSPLEISENIIEGWDRWWEEVKRSPRTEPEETSLFCNQPERFEENLGSVAFKQTL